MSWCGWTIERIVMAKVSVARPDLSTTPVGADLHVVNSSQPPVIFGAAVANGTVMAGGDMKLHLLIPFDQIPNVMPVLQYVGGAMFEVTMRRVPREQLPEPGW